MTAQKPQKNAASKTGVGPTVMVAIEQHFPPAERIIHDNLAYHILPWGMRVWAWLMRYRPLRDWMVRASEKEVPGIWSGVMCRKRYIDEQLHAAITAGQVRAVVNLGAGWDTRLYRFPEIAQVPAWEVDQAVNIIPKQAGVTQALGAVPHNITLAPINFDTENLGDVLAAQGYNADVPTFFIWEAVSQYLTEGGIRATFDFLAQAPAGSQLAFTYVRRDFITGEEIVAAERIYQTMVIKDKVWLFGWNPDEVAPFLAEYGWHVVAHLSYAELHERYTTPTGRVLPSMPIELMVLAEKK